MCPGSPLVGNSSVKSAGNFGSRPSGRGGRLWRSRHIPPLLKTFAAAARFKNAALARLAAGTRLRGTALQWEEVVSLSRLQGLKTKFSDFITQSLCWNKKQCRGFRV